jgi:hypothetical protein
LRKQVSASTIPAHKWREEGRPTGEMVTADERFFLILIHDLEVSAENWTELQHDVMSAHRWWSHADLKSTTDQIWPDDLAEMLIDAGAWKPVS